MSLWQTIFNEIKINFFDFVSEGHALIIDNVLQSFFFMMAIIELISWILNRLNLFFAKKITKSNILKVVIFLMFLYLKVWSTYSAYMEILGYFCSVTICIHLYEGCVRLGTHFCQKYSKNSFGNVSSVVSIVLIFLSFKVFRLSQLQSKDGKYNYVALFFFIFGLILVIGVFRKKQFIYFLILASMMALIIMVRHWVLELLKDSFLQKASLPLESLLYISFALQENYNAKQDQIQLQRLERQSNEPENQVQVSELMWVQAFYFIFFLVNKRMYHIEIVFASICLLSYLGTRRFY